MSTKTIELPEDLLHFADQRMKTGQYGSVVDLVREAFVALKHDEQKLERLRAEAKRGFDQLDAGLGVALSPEEALRRSDERLDI